MIDQEKRIQAAAKALEELINPDLADILEHLLEIVPAALAAADAVTAETHWIAPNEPTAQMLEAPYNAEILVGREPVLEKEAGLAYQAMRDAYLASPVESLDRKTS